MLYSVTLNRQVKEIVRNSGSQLSEQVSQMFLVKSALTYGLELAFKNVSFKLSVTLMIL